MTIVIILAGLITVLVAEFYTLGLQRGRSEGFDEAVTMFREEVQKCLNE